MGLNLNIDVNKLPHFLQTVIAMACGGLFIGSSLYFVGKNIEKSNVKQDDMIQKVDQIDNRLRNVEETQETIIDSIQAQKSLLYDFKKQLTSEIGGVENKLIYAIEHIDDMTNEQIIDAFGLGYNSGFHDGKKKEMIP